MLNRPGHSQLGVNLIEVMVILVVLGVLLTQVMPYIGDWMQGLKLRNAAESMRSGIERARMEALKRNTTVSFWMVSDSSSAVPGSGCVLSTASAAWVVSVVNPAGSCNAEASLTDAPQLAARSQAGESSSVLSVSAVSSGAVAANHVSFNSLGQVVADGANPIQVIDLAPASGSGRRLRVVVEAGGAIRTCDPGVAAGDPRVCPSL